MKLSNLLKQSLFFGALLIYLTGCHTDTPTDFDQTAPSVKLTTVTTGEDTLYNYKNEEGFTDFSLTLSNSQSYKFSFMVEDAGEMHSLKLECASELEPSKIYTVKKTKNVSDITDFEVTGADFPILIEEGAVQKLYISATGFDTYENSGSSNKFGFGILKFHPLEKFDQDLGSFTEIDGDKVVNFKELSDKLVFIQLYGYMCLSCKEEAEFFNSLYNGDNFNKEKCAIELFGVSYNGHLDSAYVKDAIKDNLDLKFDCFFDEDLRVAHWIQDYLGLSSIGNDVFAVTPNGTVLKFEHDISFEEWVNDLYNQYCGEK